MSGPAHVTAWAIVGSILMVVAVGLLIFVSAFPYWYERAPDRDVRYPHVGLWEICFRDEGEPVAAHVGDELMKTYYGCNYVLDRKLESIRDWYFTDWFLCVVILVTLGMVSLPIALILNLLFYIRVCGVHLHHVLQGASCLISWVTGLLCAIAIIVFGIKSDTDKTWLGNAESRHLSYSYGVCAVVPVLCWYAGMCHAVDFLRLKSIRDRNARIKVYERGEFGRY